MQIRPAQIADADRAIETVRRSIQQLCELDHRNDAATLSIWLGNKTADNMRRWIADHTVLVAAEGERIAGVAAVRANGEVLLNYVAPEARSRGAGKPLMQAIEAWVTGHGGGGRTPDSTDGALRCQLTIVVCGTR